MAFLVHEGVQVTRDRAITQTDYTRENRAIPSAQNTLPAPALPSLVAQNAANAPQTIQCVVPAVDSCGDENGLSTIAPFVFQGNLATLQCESTGMFAPMEDEPDE